MCSTSTSAADGRILAVHFLACPRHILKLLDLGAPLVCLLHHAKLVPYQLEQRWKNADNGAVWRRNKWRRDEGTHFTCAIMTACRDTSGRPANTSGYELVSR